MQVFLITVVVFIVYLMLSCFISVSTRFFSSSLFSLSSMFRLLSHTIYKNKEIISGIRLIRCFGTNFYWQLEEKQISEKKNTKTLVWMYHQQVSNYGTNYKEWRIQSDESEKCCSNAALFHPKVLMILKVVLTSWTVLSTFSESWRIKC